MQCTFRKLYNYYSGRGRPLINQLEKINKSYKSKFGRDIKKTDKVYLMGFYQANFFEQFLVDSLSEREIELEIFENQSPANMKELLKFFKKYGIDKNSYVLINDYNNMVVSNIKRTKKQKPEQLAAILQQHRRYILVFEEEMYNFIRLVYSQSSFANKDENFELIYDFKLKIPSLND